MMRILATLGLVVLAACAAAAQDKAALEKALIANENTIAEAVAKNDKATYTSLVAADSEMAYGTGIIKTSDFLRVAFHSIKITSWKIVDPRVIWVDANTAIVIYTWTGSGTFMGEKLPAKTYASTVWTKKADNWVAVYHQESEAVTPPPEPNRPPPPTSATLTDLKGYALGRPEAPLTMVEFTDLQCPFCREFATVTFPQIKRNWIDTGKLRYISYDFPLDVLHPHALAAARAAHCAGEQGKFWDMRFALVTNANLLSPDYITKTAADLKLATTSFAACTASNKYDAAIQADMQEGTKIGVTGTPTFLLGRTTGSALEGPVIVGDHPYATFDAKLKALSQALTTRGRRLDSPSGRSPHN